VLVVTVEQAPRSLSHREGQESTVAFVSQAHKVVA
jgi:hypothetical protein